jgi:hypothetical protein
MTRLKTLSAIVVVSAAMVTPVFAQDAGVYGPGSRYGTERQPVPYHGGGSCFQGPGFGQPCPGRLYGWSIGRDRSIPGGIEPSLRPSGS